jgi:hypothetical protein
MKRLSIFSVFLALSLILGIHSISHATLTLYITDNSGHTATIADQSGLDVNNTVGIVNWHGTLGTWTDISVTGYSKPAVGSAAKPELDSHVGSLGAGTLTILASEIGFGPASGTLQFQATVGGTFASNASAQFKYFLDTGNGLFGPGGTGGSHGTQLASLSFHEPPINFSGGASGGANLGGNPISYSLTVESDITHPSGGLTTFDQNLRAPEPTTLILLGSGLAALGIWTRRRFRR